MTLFVIFQDCWRRGCNEAWANEQIAVAEKHKIQIVPVRFYQGGADTVIREAHKHGVEMPFFTDGRKYSRQISDFVRKSRFTRKAKEQHGTTEALD